MSELKSKLKEAKQLLASGKNEEAKELCEDAIASGVKDYMIYCFAGLANSKLDCASEAANHYFEAIAIDSTTPTAWQSLFKLYDTSAIQVDARSIDVVDNFIRICDNEERKNHAIARRRDFLLELRSFSELKSDLGEDPEFLKAVVNVLSEKDVKSASEKLILEKCFASLEEEMSSNAGLHLQYAKYLYAMPNPNYESWKQEVFNHCKWHSSNDDWIIARIEEIICTEFLCEKDIEDEVFEWYDSESRTESKLCDLIASVEEEDWVQCGETIAEMSDSDLQSLPLIKIAIRILFEEENYERCLRCLDWSASHVSDSITVDNLTGFRVRCLLELGDSSCLAAARKLCPLIKRFAEDEARLAVVSNEDWKTLFGGNLSDEALNRMYVREAIVTKQWDTCADSAAKLLSSGEWKDLLLYSEYAATVGIDPAPFLIKTARLNPRCTRTFHLLAKTLANKNPVKARSCAERAVKSRPLNEEYVHLLDDIYQQQGVGPDVRLKLLNTLATRAKPMWLRSRRATLLLKCNKADEGIDELQQVLRLNPGNAEACAQLAAAYTKRGNLQSAMNTYARLLELLPDSDYAIPMIQVILRIGNIELALQKCSEWKGVLTGEAQKMICLFEADARFRKAQTLRGDERIEELNTFFALVGDSLKAEVKHVVTYKLAADGLFYCASFHKEVFKQLKLPLDLQTPLSSVWTVICSLYMTALTLDRTVAGSWADLGIALTRRAAVEANPALAKKACDCLRRAIRLSSDCTTTRSLYWTRLADALRVSASPRSHLQHCLVRAIQLNKANAEAWFRLALVYAESNMMNESNQAVETAVKYCPEMAEAWCLWGHIAVFFLDRYQSLEMFRQSLTYKPTSMAVRRYVVFLVEDRASSFDPSSSMIQFESVLALYERCDRCPSLVLHLAVLAELFGYLKEAADLLKSVQVPEAVVHLQRTQLKASEDVPSPDDRLSPLVKLAKSASEGLFDLLQRRIPIYQDLLSKVMTGEGLPELLRERRTEISIPLLLALLHRFNIGVSDEVVRSLHDVRPRHELIDYWPTVVPEGLDTEMHFIEEDGEQPFRLQHHAAKPLFHAFVHAREAVKATGGDTITKKLETLQHPLEILVDASVLKGAEAE